MTTITETLPETITVESHQVACDGGPKGKGGPLGHPRVWLNLGATGHVDCGYCGRHYMLAADATVAAH